MLAPYIKDFENSRIDLITISIVTHYSFYNILPIPSKHANIALLNEGKIYLPCSNIKCLTYGRSVKCLERYQTEAKFRI